MLSLIFDDQCVGRGNRVPFVSRISRLGELQTQILYDDPESRNFTQPRVA